VLLEIESISNILTWIRFVNFDSQSQFNDCFAPLTAQQQTLLAVLMPMLLVAELYAIACCHYFFAKASAKYRVAKDGGAAAAGDGNNGIAGNGSIGVAGDGNGGVGGGVDVVTIASSRSCFSRVVLFAGDCDWNRYRATVIAIMLFSYTQVKQQQQ
jgi:hypothetical protein